MRFIFSPNPDGALRASNVSGYFDRGRVVLSFGYEDILPCLFVRLAAVGCAFGEGCVADVIAKAWIAGQAQLAATGKVYTCAVFRC